MADTRDWSESDYSRLYHSILRDPKFATIYPDDRAWALYTRLLMASDAGWPSPVHLPRSASRYAVAKLVEAGVIVLIGDLCTIPALVKERAHRYGKGKGRPRYPSDGAPAPEPVRSSSESGRSNAVEEPESGRSDPEAHARGRVSPSPSISPSDSEVEDRARDDEPERPALARLAGWGAHVEPNGNGIHRKLIDLVRRRGIVAALRALEDAHTADPSASGRQLVFAAEDALDRSPKPSAKSKGLGPNAEEVERAFGR